MFKVIIYSNSIKEFEKINPWKDWLDELPQQIQNRIIPYQLASDRQMRILGKIQLKQLLRDFSLLHEDGRGEGNIRGMATIFDLNNLCYSEFNKPYFRVDATHLISEQSFYFNTSHSGGLTVCAGTLIGEIGIDVEEVSGSEKMIQNLAGGTGEKPELTIQLWTAQEAAHKAAGWGVMNGLGEQGGISKNKIYESKSYAGKIYRGLSGVKIVELELSDEYVGHVAVRTEQDFEVEYRRDLKINIV